MKHMTLDHSTEIRQTYVGAVPHTLFTAAVWITAAFLAGQFSSTQAIVFFIVAGTFIFPGGELLRKLFHAPSLISAENKLPQFFTLLAFTIPLSYPLVYLVCKGNVNYFFPAFTILIGAHYLPFVYGYRMWTFGVLSVLLVTQGTLVAFYFPEHFNLSGYLTGFTLFVFAILHYLIIKKEKTKKSSRDDTLVTEKK